MNPRKMAAPSRGWKAQASELAVRVRALEEVNRFTVDALEAIIGQEDVLPSINRLDDPMPIMADMLARIGLLIPCEAKAVCFVDENTADFVIRLVEPEAWQARITAEMEAMIRNDVFGWALREKRPLVVPSADGTMRFLLHTVATPTRIRGMFMGFLSSEADEILDVNWSLFSLVLQRGANALESFELYRIIKQANARHQRQAEERRILLDNIPTQVWYLTDAHTYGAVNRAHAAFLGKPQSELAFRDMREIFPREVAEHFQRENTLVFASGRPARTEEWMMDASGDQRLLLILKTPWLREDKSVEYVVCSAEDITQRKQEEMQRENVIEELEESKSQLQARLHQAEKMSSLSRVSAGVAHEILNPLGIISLELQMLKEIQGLAPQVYQELEVCMDQVRRIVDIADNLKQFSRISSETMVLEDLNVVIAGVLQIYETQFKIENVHVLKRLDSRISPLPLDRKKIEQVLINLFSNALAAMESKEVKRLDVHTRLESVGTNQYARIVVSDTGTGIKEKDLQRIFDPFYTTRDQGKGTGMGLSITHGIVQQHGGRIRAENNTHGGASFIVELPLVRERENGSSK